MWLATATIQSPLALGTGRANQLTSSSGGSPAAGRTTSTCAPAVSTVQYGGGSPGAAGHARDQQDDEGDGGARSGHAASCGYFGGVTRNRCTRRPVDASPT